MAVRKLSETQENALGVLVRCGRLTKKSARRHGVAFRTLNSLVERGDVRVRYVGIVNPQPVWEVKRWR